MMQPKKNRLDQLLVDKYGYATRSRARDAIVRGTVLIGGKAITKPGQTIGNDETIQIDDPAQNYVSRAALKLVHALEQSGIDPAGLVGLDIGASTGGFTQVLLERGAKKVFSVDVGSGQIRDFLAQDKRVVNLENLNARDLTSQHIDQEKPELIVSDVSFISLKLALPPALNLAPDNGQAILLIKPQFEVGRQGLARGGIVRDESLIRHTVKDLKNWLNQQPGWRVIDIYPSPIIGGDGNKEFLMIGKKNCV